MTSIPSAAPAVDAGAPLTRDQSIRYVTESYLASLTEEKDPHEIATDLVDLANAELDRINATMMRDAAGKLSRISDPTLSQISLALIRLHHVIRIGDDGVSSTRALLAVYMDRGKLAGTYSTDEGDIRRLARRYRTSLTRNQIFDLMQELLDEAPERRVCDDRDLIAVNNGIFDYRTKTLQEFTPEIVLLSKSPVDFVENPVSPVIHNTLDDTDWELESWMREIASVPDPNGGPGVVDEEVVEVLWQIAGAVIRPLVKWNKAAFLYSTSGNNGKGTYAEFLRSLTGPAAAANIPLADMGKEFYLESLTNQSAIIADENDVGIFLDKVGNLKALITHDMIFVNRKNRAAITMRWRGFMVQCLNSLPESRDKSQSFYRRQLFVPFRNRFEGVERKYIKDDYLHRKEVLEYALHRVLTMPDYHELETPSASQHLMAEYQLANDNVREFWCEISAELVWDIVPNAFLYSLFVAWMARNNPSGRPLGRNRFLSSLRELISEDPGWNAPMNVALAKPQLIRVGRAMDAPEPLINTYNLTDWMQPGYNGTDLNKRCTTAPVSHTTGIVRALPSATA